MKRLALLMTAVGVVALCTVGCDSSKEQELQFYRKQNQELTQRVAELEDQLESVQKTNQRLTQRVAELEGQLKKQAETTVSTVTKESQTFPPESIYVVKEGDSLWDIAEKQLGNGIRYKEILTLNPHIREGQPLFVGTQLKMPPNREIQTR